MSIMKSEIKKLQNNYFDEFSIISQQQDGPYLHQNLNSDSSNPNYLREAKVNVL